jgi:hypothetical protein
LLAEQQLLAYRRARTRQSQERKLRHLRAPRARATFGLVRDVVPAIPGHRLRSLLAFSQRFVEPAAVLRWLLRMFRLVVLAVSS